MPVLLENGISVALLNGCLGGGLRLVKASKCLFAPSGGLRFSPSPYLFHRRAEMPTASRQNSDATTNRDPKRALPPPWWKKSGKREADKGPVDQWAR
jgi:hypothetical protein